MNESIDKKTARVRAICHYDVRTDKPAPTCYRPDEDWTIASPPAFPNSVECGKESVEDWRAA